MTTERDYLERAKQCLIDSDRTESDTYADRLIRRAEVSALVAIAQELRQANKLAAERKKTQ